MTDNEIIKALECCARLNRKCNECPLINDGAISEHCISVIRYEALDLIKRQQAEIEKCKTILTELSNIGYCHNFQLERSDIVDYINAVSEVVKKAKNKLEGDNGE